MPCYVALCTGEREPVCLLVSRELAFQLAEQFRALGAGMALKDTVIVGGLDMQVQLETCSSCISPACASVSPSC